MDWRSQESHSLGCYVGTRNMGRTALGNTIYKACPSESGTEVGAPLFPAVELCDFSGRWQCMSGEIWYTLDSGSSVVD